MKNSIICLFMLSAIALTAQIKFRTNLDLGLVTSGFTQTSIQNRPQLKSAYVNEVKPIISPTYGFNILADYRGWFTEIGVQSCKVHPDPSPRRILTPAPEGKSNGVKGTK